MEWDGGSRVQSYLSILSNEWAVFMLPILHLQHSLKSMSSLAQSHQKQRILGLLEVE